MKDEDERLKRRKKRLKNQALLDKVMGFLGRIVAVIFWIGMIITFIGGCFGTFFKSADSPQDDYEEYVHSTIP